MFGRSKIRALCASVITTAVVLGWAAGPAGAAPAATTAALTGTVLYDKNSNVFVTNGVTTRQVTTDGTSPSTDGTGNSGYLVPTQSDSGSVVVAVRNQTRTSSDQQTYLRGYLWVMDAYGHVIRKINPPQYAYDGGTTCNMPANSPQGIANAQVSPDGKHIAYTIRELVEVWGIYGCYVATSYRTTVVGSDGTNPMLLTDGTGDATAAEDLEIGSWVSNSMLLLDRLDFGSVATYTVTLPSSAGHAWFGPSSYTDTGYAQPDVRNGVLVTEGLSDSSSHNVLRVWTTSGYTSDPSYRCEFGSTVDPADSIGDPSLSPDGAQVAYQDSDANGSTAAAGQGIYLAPSTCGTPQLLVAGGHDAFWSPAGIDPPPSVVITAHPANPTRATSASVAFTVSHSGAAPTVTCRLDARTASACSSPVSYTGLSDGVHTVTVAAGSSARSYAWRVDTTRPVVTLTAPTALGVAATTVPQNWAGSDTGSGIVTYQAQYAAARWSGGFSAWTNFGSPYPAATTRTTVSGLSTGYTYCLRVRAADRAGNLGYSASRCFAVALDDRAMTRSSGWQQLTGSAYYARTITTTTKLGASLSRSGAVTDRIGIVARTGPGYGTVGLYVGATLVARLSLAASTTHYRTVLFGPRFALRSGTVTVKVLTSGRPVAIDGVLISRT